LKGWAILHAIICLIFVWIGRYQFFEKVMSLLTGIMFITLNLTKQQLLGHVRKRGRDCDRKLLPF
jgi:hypothetical protein